NRAIEIADRVAQPSLQTEARLALGLVLFKLERYEQAEEQINGGLTIIPSLEDAQEINAKYLDLKANFSWSNNPRRQLIISWKAMSSTVFGAIRRELQRRCCTL